MSHGENPRPAQGEPSQPGSRVAWIAGPLLGLAGVLAALFVRTGPDALLGWAIAALIGIPAVWILVSVLFPASADRTCPACGRTGLYRLDPESTRGIACRHCGHEDESASAFLLAEDDGGPLEAIVLRERERRPQSMDERA